MNKPPSDEYSTPRLYRAPLRYSLVVALVYLVLCGIYIVLSDRWVTSVAETSARAARLQLTKGILFVSVSATIIFILSLALLRRIAKTQATLQSERQALVKAERRAAAGLLASSIAHDMNNVLTVGMANVEMLRARDTLDSTAAEMLRDIERSFDRLHTMARRLSRTDRLESAEPSAQMDLAQLFQREIKFIRRHQSAINCTISYYGPDHLYCAGHEATVHEMLGNLLINAAEATNGRGRIEVHLKPEGQSAVVEVHDNGPGIPAEQQHLIFEPLYTTKRGGLGLGLLSVKSAAKMHRGWVEVVNSPLGGACFRITLPGITDSGKE